MDLVVNPRAGAGRAGRALGDVARELARAGFSVDVHMTERPGHAGEIIRKLLREGRASFGIMGGDGTFHESLDGFYDESNRRIGPEDATLALVPAGTGGD